MAERRRRRVAFGAAKAAGDEANAARRAIDGVEAKEEEEEEWEREAMQRGLEASIVVSL